MRHLYFFLSFLLLLSFSGCKKVSEWRRDPDITPLKDGLKTAATMGYCASVASALFRGEELPPNVIVRKLNKDGISGSAILTMHINESTPLPFNTKNGEITIAGVWTGNSGVFSAVFTDIDILNSRYQFYGIYTVPVKEMANGKIVTAFAKQDIVLGYGTDTLLNLSLTEPKFNLEIARLDESQPDDVFVAVSQNVWFVNINRNNTSNYVYDDTYEVNGGGQIAEATSESGGIRYHALIEASFTSDLCQLNPHKGSAFIQNIKAGENIDLGTLLLNFHDDCDGKAYVEVATGEYFRSIRRNINLKLSD